MLKPLLALALLAVYALMFILSRSQEGIYLQEIRDYGFKIPYLAWMGLYVTSLVSFELPVDYETRVKAKICELFGRRELASYYKIHRAQRVVLIFTVAWAAAVVALLGEVDFSFLLFGLSLVVLVCYWADQELDRKLKIKKRDILIDLPEILNVITLLVNAGLPYTAALQRAVRESDNRRPLYRELNTMLAEINAGKPVSQAYEELGQRCKVPEVTRFVSTVMQNLTRGGADLVYVLRTMTHEAWERRKDIARKQGEEASSKLVIPMVMVFIAVAIIVMAPAVITMSR